MSVVAQRPLGRLHVWKLGLGSPGPEVRERRPEQRGHRRSRGRPTTGTDRPIELEPESDLDLRQPISVFRVEPQRSIRYLRTRHR